LDGAEVAGFLSLGVIQPAMLPPLLPYLECYPDVAIADGDPISSD
jgi:hypothetical protein